jgi:hypothetical protein
VAQRARGTAEGERQSSARRGNCALCPIVIRRCELEQGGARLLGALGPIWGRGEDDPGNCTRAAKRKGGSLIKTDYGVADDLSKPRAVSVPSRIPRSRRSLSHSFPTLPSPSGPAIVAFARARRPLASPHGEGGSRSAAGGGRAGAPRDARFPCASARARSADNGRTTSIAF